jgi:hypothetical protein
MRRGCAIRTEILSAVQAQSQARDQWRPVLTKAEWVDEQARLTALAADERRWRYAQTLLHAEVMAGLRAITTASVDLIATNPPYGMGIADWDHIPDYLAWAKPWLTECVWVLKPASSLYMFGRLESLAELIDLLERLGLQFQDFLIWETIQGASDPPLWVKRNKVRSSHPFVSEEEAYVHHTTPSTHTIAHPITRRSA